MEIAIIGGGIVGLGLALNLRQRGLDCRVYEAVPEVKELGVGITLLPHAMRELARLGLQERLEPLGGVKAYPARVKCATLAWHAFEAALRSGAVGATVKTE